MADPLATLHEIRMPVLDGWAALASGLASLAVGLALALAAGSLMRLLTRRREGRRAAAWAALERARALPEPERFAALLRVIAGLAGGRGGDWPERLAARFGAGRVPVAELEDLRGLLYRSGEPPDLANLEALAERLVRRVRR